MGNESRQKLETRCSNTAAVCRCEEVPNHLFPLLAFSLFCVLCRVQLQNVNQFAVIHFSVSDAPRTYELETIREGLKHARCDSVEVCFRYLFIIAHFFWLLQLLICEVQKHLESKFEYFRLFFEGESVLEVGLCKARYLWI